MSNTATSSSDPTDLRIALTPGEPAGIGPDLAVLVARDAAPAAIVHYADPALLAARARRLGVALRIHELDDPRAARPLPAGELQVVPVTLAADVEAGRLDAANAAYVLRCLDLACDACATGALDAMVTGPVQKSIINDAGHAFSGHTEYLAARLAAPLPVMMLASGALRVVLLTTHVPLRDVPALVTAARLEAVIEVTLRDLATRFGISAPRLGVCGLNPHAGENGHLGREELDIIAPTLAALRARGYALDGPLPADTAFTASHRKQYDAILALYHDQGLTALKAVSFGDAVNITLGLPIVRTSVDHGTALDRAGRGTVDTGSLHAALTTALEIALVQAQRG
ncbi:MAG: 4-hydroxythreonine-4-phosphate dehydrogenase PdxA [Gammaproteobacteria bacterium]